MPTTDQFPNYHPTPVSPAAALSPVVPNDGADFAQVTVGLNVATPGVVRVTTLAGDIGDITVAAGVFFPIRATRVWETGTTATGICGFF